MILSEFGHASTNQNDRVASSRLLSPHSINQNKLRSTRLPGSLHSSSFRPRPIRMVIRLPRLALPGSALVAAMKMLSVCDTSRWPPTRALLRYTDCQCDACSALEVLPKSQAFLQDIPAIDARPARFRTTHDNCRLHGLAMLAFGSTLSSSSYSCFPPTAE